MRLLLVSAKPVMFGIGGVQSLVLHTLEVLSQVYDVTFITFDANLDLAKLGEIYGCRVSPGSFQLRRIAIPTWLYLPRFDYLRQHLMMRYVKPIAGEFDVVFSASGEMDLGVRGIQYIACPAPFIFGKYKGSLMARVYRQLLFCLSHASFTSMARNYTLVISEWTRRKTYEVYGIHSKVVYPPVEVPPPDLSPEEWFKREEGFVCIGRLTPDKRVELIISILKKVREQSGVDVHLHVVGEWRNEGYKRRIMHMVEHEPWVQFEGTVPQSSLLALMQKHKYGIHAMPNEHFGIGVAQMVLSGCLTFVPNDGGQVEIVQDKRLIYQDEADAIQKIISLMLDRQLQLEVLASLTQQSERFSREAFRRNIISAVTKFVENIQDDH
jgi:glycosyltransferase involved in cell wall biosynthesis